MKVGMDPRTVDEELRVQLWRFEQFAGLGFDAIEATVLARSDEVDLALVRRMRDRGCSPELVLQIVF
jgi:hypothetical protein